MNRDRVPTARLRRALVTWASVVALAATGAAAAQADGVTFDVEILRVDLVVNDDGETVERFEPVTEAVPGEEIEYRVTVRNEGSRIYRPGTLPVRLPIGEGVRYVAGSVGPVDGDLVVDASVDGGETFTSLPADPDADDGDADAFDPAAVDTLRWTFTVPFEPGMERVLVYRVQVL
ncbi:MAG: hypothetical protein RI554_09485 [Trueperaceae bacterium]|nr:hypothetical protein [Trueperaceae bacterium]